ncbi:MAG: VWA-like domain-containing protein [candidate division KSB1 bacterium]|nr:VWA-like domain-containing protein [candidate division KSB1 bacterium]
MRSTVVTARKAAAGHLDQDPSAAVPKMEDSVLEKEENVVSPRTRQLLEEARLIAIDRKRGWPFFVDTVYAMTRCVVWTTNVPRAAVDQWWRLYINPRWVEESKVTADQMAAVLMHEGWHILQEYWRRARLKGVPEELSEVWNLAADAVVNQIDRLTDRLPGDHVRHSDLGLPPNGTTEEYYDLLLQRAQKVLRQIRGGRGASAAESPNGAGVGGGSGEDRGQSSPDEKKASGGGGNGGKSSPDRAGRKSSGNDVDDLLKKAIVGPPSSGSGTHGHKRSWELGAPSKEDGGISQHEQDQIRATTARRILEEKARGSVPGAAVEWAEAFSTPRVDWRRELAAAVAVGVASTGYGSKPTYRKLSRRQTGGPVIRPGRELRRPRVAVAIDTSGSMGEADLSAALAEVQAILERNSRSLLVACVDAEVQSVQQVTSAKRLELRGRGGTDMCKAIEWADGLYRQGRLDMLVLLTDGLTPWPETPPDFGTVIGWIHRKGTGFPGGPDWVRDAMVDIELD